MSDDDKPTVVDEFFEVTGLTGGSFLTRGTAAEPRAPGPAERLVEHPAERLVEHPAEQQAARIMAQASRFQNTGRIGVGGMGEVHKVYDQVLQRQVAMKNLLAELARSTTTTRRFLQEVLITAQLDHPNIVPVYDVGFHDGGSAFFVMKLVRGENLAARIRSHHGQPLTSRQLEGYLRIFLKVCEAVDFAHSRGVIHRDLKPSNIMVGPHGEVFVMDWGIALVRNDDSAQSPEHVRTSQVALTEDPDMILGTAAYMAPEQARAETDDIDARTDIFALGGILYHILTSQPPYPGPELAVQIVLAGEGNVPHPARVVQDRRLPPRLCRITMKALARRREDRYQSVAALAEDVEAFLRGGGWFDTVHFAPGTIIVNEGDEPDAAYIIEKGRCEVFKIRNGRRHTLRMLGPGDVFGETSIFTGMPRTATVVALDEVRAASITREALDLELAEKGWLAAFVKGLAERFNDYDESSIELRMKTES
jgi:CRP-like cAMP-binding protein/tRNA A-37 threonylcarbamoyl transferase component Bud32